MREIKFRAWDKLFKKMYLPDDFMEGEYWKISPHFLISPNGNKLWSNIQDIRTRDRMEEDIVIMQYTGLKDKNGKEIYEGDILGLNETILPDKQTEFGQVEVRFGAYDDSEIEYGSPGFGWWVTGYHGYNRLNGITDKYVIEEHSLLTVCDEYEIIGNIYENPELLKRHC